MLQMLPKILNNSPSGKIRASASFNFISVFSHPLNMIFTLKPTILPLLLSKNFTIKPINLFLNKTPPECHISNHKITFLFAYYSLNHFFTVGTIRNYDPIKQNYMLSPYHVPIRPLFVPKERSISMMIFVYLHTYPLMSQTSFQTCLN